MKIFCIGRNYAAHIEELKNETPGAPVIFMKPPTALLMDNKPFYYPDFSKDIHYECELVLKVCKNGRAIHEKFASKYYDHITLGLTLLHGICRNIKNRKVSPGKLPKLLIIRQ